MLAPFDAVVIGGGYFGLRIALHLRDELGFATVLVLEKEDELMSRASFVNQARVHHGYHYPRSLLTALRSLANVPKFSDEFGDAMVDSFEHYYAVASVSSKVTPRQFELFCSRIGALWEPADASVSALFDRGRIGAAYRVVEPAFSAHRVLETLLERIASVGGIDIHLGEEAVRIEGVGGRVRVETDRGEYTANRVVGAVYSRINDLHRNSGLVDVGLQHEVTEMALVKMPAPLTDLAVTVMDGPFFSVMPFPDRGLHTLSHVRYTPQYRWNSDADDARDPHRVLADWPRASNFPSMLRDVVRYMPSLGAVSHQDSIYEIKTVLTKSATDDSRPILFLPDFGIPGYTCVMGGKLDNVYDVLEELTHLYGK